MTVKELKDILNLMPNDAEVVITVDFTDSIHSVTLNDADSHIPHQYVEIE